MKPGTGFLLFLAFFLAGCTARSRVGVIDGLLAPCETQACVSSQSDVGASSIEPIPYQYSPAEARKALLQTLSAMKGVQVVQQDPDYIRAETKRGLFRSVVDLEFYFPITDPLIHVRFASRNDLGSTDSIRTRVDEIRKLFTTRLRSTRPEP